MAALIGDCESSEQRATVSRQRWRGFLGIVISCVSLAWIVWRIDRVELLSSLSHFRWPYLFWGLLSLAGGYALRVVRWAVLLRAAGARISSAACVAPFLGSIVLNNILPMRAGDAMRILVFPAAIGVGKVAAAGSVLMERLVDVMTLLAFLAMGLAFSSEFRLPEWMAGTVVSLAVLSILGLLLVFLFSSALSQWCVHRGARAAAGDRSMRIRLFAVFRDLLDSLNAMSRVPVLLTLFALSMLVWVGEAGLFWTLLWGFGLEATAATAAAVMVVATLSTLLPSSPGYIGPFHLAAFAAVSALGGTPGQAASFAIVSHLGLWLPTTLAGALVFLIKPQLFSAVQTK